MADQDHRRSRPLEFGAIAEKFESLATRSAPLFSATKLEPQALVMFTEAIMLTNVLIGFSGAYIFTRMFLVSAFFRIDAANQELLARSVERVSEVSSAAIFEEQTTPDERRSAIDLLKVPITSLRTREDFVAWAKAHLIYRDYGSAAEALKRALDAAGWKDPELLGLYARTLSAQGNASDARSYLEMARKLAEQHDPARMADIVADQLDGALATGLLEDLRRADALLKRLGEQVSSPRILALTAALRAQELGLTGGDGKDAVSLASESLEALRALSRNSDPRVPYYARRLLAGLDNRDALFGALRHLPAPERNSALQALEPWRANVERS